MAAAAAKPSRAKTEASDESFRKDPRPRAIGGVVRLELENKDPRFKYVAVYRGDADAMMSYTWQGYTPVTVEPGGVRIRGLRTAEDGQELTYKGHVVMALPKDEWQAAYDEGQRLADARMKAMEGRAPLRKLGATDFMPMVNETTGLYEEA